jgi:hypothetical protein
MYETHNERIQKISEMMAERDRNTGGAKAWVKYRNAAHVAIEFLCEELFKWAEVTHNYPRSNMLYYLLRNGFIENTAEKWAEFRRLQKEESEQRSK